MTNQTPPQLSDEERANWVREQFQKANKYLAENGILFDSVVTEESRYLEPYFAVWKLKSLDNEYYWVISGDLPADFIPFNLAETARDAVNHFSLNWQMKAENIKRNANADATQIDFANLLQSRAESLYKIKAADDLWA